jgi:hypothetical protein
VDFHQRKGEERVRERGEEEGSSSSTCGFSSEEGRGESEGERRGGG